MEEHDANQILKRTRSFYHSGKKTYNKIYILDEHQKADGYLVEKASRRLSAAIESEKLVKATRNNPVASYNTPAGNCYPMAMRAAASVIESGGGAHIGLVQAPGDHAFCIADFPPAAPCPGHVDEMCWYDFKSTWIIDPWMNICCRFAEYPAEVSAKLAVWSVQGKRVRFGPNWQPHDPNGAAYSHNFLKSGRLRIDNVALVLAKDKASGTFSRVPWLV